MKPIKIEQLRQWDLIAHLLIAGVLLFFFVDLFFNLELEKTPVILTLAVLVVGTMAIRYKHLLLYGLAFIVPLSVQLPITENAKMSVPSEMIALLLSLFLVAKIILGYRPSKQFLRHPITVLILLDISWLFLTSCLSGMPIVSFKRFAVRLIYYITFYYFFYELYVHNQKNIKRVLLLSIVGMLTPILLTTVKHFNMDFSMVGSQKISAPFYFDHTIYGACLVLYIPFLVFQLNLKQSKKEKLFYIFLFLVFIIATWLSFSRAAWLSLIVAMLLFAALKYKISIKTQVYACSFALLCFLLTGPKLSNIFSETKQISHTNDVAMHLKSVSNISTDASNKERINRWKCAVRMFADKPIFGFGPGTYQFFYGPYQVRSELTRISTFTGNKGHAHSEYLNYLSETGLPGFIIFISLVITVCTRGLSIAQNRINQDHAAIALYTVIALLTFFIHAFFNGFLEFDKMAMPVFSAMAVITFLDVKNELIPKPLIQSNNT